MSTQTIPTVHLGTVSNRDARGRFVAVYTLQYQIKQRDGRWIRITRGLHADGVERLGRHLAILPEEVVVNIGVSDARGEDYTFDFECFAGDEPVVSAARRAMAYQLMSFVPSEQVAA